MFGTKTEIINFFSPRNWNSIVFIKVKNRATLVLTRVAGLINNLKKHPPLVLFGSLSSRVTCGFL